MKELGVVKGVLGSGMSVYGGFFSFLAIEK
jgi:hypothetical protein